MGEPGGFLKYKRQDVGHRAIKERIADFQEMELPLTESEITEQAARCMDCGIPFCQSRGTGCPVENNIPDFNEMVYQGRWQEACDQLHSTNNFPEFTGRVCPAPCEAACTLNVNDNPVLIQHIEHQIVERGFREGWLKAQVNPQKTGKRIAIVGSGPAGLAAAQQLARAGHEVVVFEKDEYAGGLMRYGIPDFKLEKPIIERRLEQLMAEGVTFQCGVTVGEDISARYLQKMFDCVCLTMGAGQPRELNIPGRGYENILFAMDYLTEQNKRNTGESTDRTHDITAKDKVVIVIGGGDTGSDCVGTARRQGAKEIHQLEILPKPPDSRAPETPWPLWPRMMRTSSSQEEGCERQWSVSTRKFSGGAGIQVKQLHGCQIEWIKKGKAWKPKEVPGTEFTLQADLVLLALGFVHVVHDGLVRDLDIQLDDRGNVKTQDHQTSQPWVFAAGDAAFGASLVVRAIKSGRDAAVAIDRWLRS